MSSEPQAVPAVTVRNVGKRYEIYARPLDRLKQAFTRGLKKYHQDFWALENVSFEVKPGEALGIIGVNGSGKSTLLQIISRTLTPTNGWVDVKGRVAALLELGSGFNPEFTGRENVYLNTTILGLTAKEIAARYGDIVAFADIGDYIDQPIKTYSTGMVMRLAFAVQVQVQPEVLIIDEALAVGDNLFQKRCFQKMEELREQGVTILFVSHDQESVRTLTDRALLLHQGKPAAYGNSADVVLEYRRLLAAIERDYINNRLNADQRRVAEIREAAAAAQASGEQHPKLKSFGSLEAEVLGVEVLNGRGEPDAVFYPGDPMRIRVRTRVHKRMNHLNISLRIRNKQGIKMYSWGTLNQDISIWSGRAQGAAFWERTFEAGQEVAAEFSCACPLGWNFYEIQAAISEENDPYYKAQRMLHWRDEAAFFQVQIAREEYFFGGACDMRMKVEVDPAA